MKKKTKIILIVIVSIISLFIICGNVDYNRIKNDKAPILSIRGRKNKLIDSEIWYGFGYIITRCSNIEYDGKYRLSILSLTYACFSSFDVDIEEEEYRIVNDSSSCETFLEEIARDSRFIYYLDCKKSETIFLEYENGYQISIKEALKNKRVSIDELISKGLEVYQKRIRN